MGRRFLDGDGLWMVLSSVALALSGKVDREAGMGLSERSFTSAHEAMLTPFRGGSAGLVPPPPGSGGTLHWDGTWAMDQADWEETDPGKAGYVRNRPFGEVVTLLIPPQTAALDESGTAVLKFREALKEGMQVHLVVDGIGEDREVLALGDTLYLGNALHLTGDERMDTGEGYCIAFRDGQMLFLREESGGLCRVQAETRLVRKLDARYVSGDGAIPVPEILALFGGDNA